MDRRFPGKFHGVVFDLDGTLVHSAPDIAAALNIVLCSENIAPFANEETYRFIGHGAASLIADAFTARGRALEPDVLTDLTARYLAAYAERGSPDTTLFPGIVDALHVLRSRGLPLAVCTNKAEALSRQVVAELGLAAFFGAVIGSDSGFGRKPAAGPLEEACRRIGVKAANVLLVGDTITDVRTAEAAQCAVAVVRHGYSQVPVETLGAHAILDAVADVPRLVAA